MEEMRERLFSFTSDALPPGTFEVVGFTGTEGLSRLYDFDILVVSDVLDISLESVIRETAHLTIHRHEGKNAVFHGLPVEFEQLHAVNNVGFYRVRLVPRLWRLSLIRNNQVIMDKPLIGFLTDILNDGGLSSLDFEFRLQGKYYPRQYICQYAETHLDFLSRWLEREGIYYFFEQGEDREKVIFTNTAIAHTDHPLGKTLQYHPVSGLAESHSDEVICNFACRQRLSPGKVFVKEYNDLRPSLNVSGSSSISETGFGQVYYYHENFRIPEEGERLAKIRAESLACQEKVFHGDSFVPYLAPGFTFGLQGHFRSDYNRDFNTIDVRHEGNQTSFLTAGLQTALSDRERTAFYRNEFSAIASDVQFRAERTTPWPKISGTISARVDASGSGKYAELDAFGRYRVVLPFDLAGHPEGKASAWVRMAQPYAGANHGMHFPLHKGTEVLLTFIDGDPDRPIIAGAVPNAESLSVVRAGNAKMGGFATAAGNCLHADDTEGSEGFFMRLGGKGDDAGIALTRNSPSCFTNYSTANLNLIKGGIATGVAGIGNLWKLFQNNTFTGFPLYQVIVDSIQDLVLGRGIPLVDAKYQTDAANVQADMQKTEIAMIQDLANQDKAKYEKDGGHLLDDQKKLADDQNKIHIAQMTEMFGTVGMLVIQILSGLYLTKVLKDALAGAVPAGTAGRWVEIVKQDGFRVSSAKVPIWGTGVAVQQKQLFGNPAISLICDTGPVMTYSKEDTHIVSNESINIVAMGRGSRKGLTMQASSGDVNIIDEDSTGKIKLNHLLTGPMQAVKNASLEMGRDSVIIEKNDTYRNLKSTLRCMNDVAQLSFHGGGAAMLNNAGATIKSMDSDQAKSSVTVSENNVIIQNKAGADTGSATVQATGITLSVGGCTITMSKTDGIKIDPGDLPLKFKTNLVLQPNGQITVG